VLWFYSDNWQTPEAVSNTEHIAQNTVFGVGKKPSTRASRLYAPNKTGICDKEILQHGHQGNIDETFQHWLVDKLLVALV
jgi:hypothetical protein